MRVIGQILQTLGVFIFLFGVIMGVHYYKDAKDDRHDLKISKETYDSLYDNEFARAYYTSARQIYLNDMAVVALWGGLGVIGGLIGFGTGSILVKLDDDDEIIGGAD